MAKGFKVINQNGGDHPTSFPVQFKVKAGTAGSIIPGMLVVKDGSNAGYVAEAANGAANTALVVGVAASTSTETAAADGLVTVTTAPVLLCKAKATTPGNLATSVLLTKVTLDVSGTDHTVDENDTTNGFISIVDYDNTTDGNVTVSIPCNQFTT